VSPEPDQPTGLPGRADLLSTLREREAGTLIVLDLDHLAFINAALSHAAGDDVLRRATEVLRETVGPGAALARVGDARLAALLEDVDPMSAHALASLALTQLRGRVAHWPGASAGVSSWYRREDAEQALAAATLAAHEASRDGAAPVGYAEVGSDGPLAWAERLRVALAEERLVLHAQPICDLVTGEIVRHELLVRMRDGVGGLVAPGAFLPAAERFGLIGELDLWVAGRSLALVAAGHPVAINVSLQSLGDERLLALLERGLRPGGQAASLTVELSEAAVTAQRSWSGLTLLRRLTGRGCLVALDNFGTGGSSLAALRDLPVDQLKLDSGFAADLRPGSRGRVVLDTIIQLAGRLGIDVVAGGVDDERTATALREAGVGYVQGFARGRPLELSVAGLAA
jgi:EAL domain-containing protein (putative c-di-GMP-specific phosphodiesterase class I)/GGDEF domain-containing protein